MAIHLSKPTRISIVLVALALPIFILAPLRHRIAFPSTTRPAARTLPEAPIPPIPPKFPTLNTLDAPKARPTRTAITQEEQLLVNEVLASAFDTIIKPWELQNVSYRLIRPSQSAEELIATLGPLDTAIQSAVKRYICENLRSNASPERSAIIETYALQRAASLYNNQVFTQISFHLSDNSANPASAYDSIMLDYAVAPEQFNLESRGLARGPLPHEQEAFRSRLDLALFQAPPDSLLPDSGPLDVGLLKARYGHLFQITALE